MEVRKKQYWLSKSSVSLCRKCRSIQRQKEKDAERKVLTRHQVVSAMYAYLMNSWEELPDENKRVLGFDPEVGSKSEEEGFNHLSQLFMDYADLSFQWSLAARRRRLNINDELPQARRSVFEDTILSPRDR